MEQIIENIPQEKILEITHTTEKFVQEVITPAISWIDRYIKDEDRVNILKKLKKYRRQLFKFSNILPQRPVIALFGRSQVGKSYVTSSFLTKKGQDSLYIVNPQTKDKIDFIAYCNPPGGGVEATGVVTRFTIENKFDSEDLPIKIKVFSVKDIITILVDAYLSDLRNYKKNYSIEELKDFVKKIEKYKQSSRQTYLTEDDIWDIYEYIFTYFPDDSHMLKLNDVSFWDVLAENIEYIPTEKWINILKILWRENEKFTELFNSLLGILKRIDFADEITTEFDTIILEKGGLLNVIRVYEYYTPEKAELFRPKVKVNGREITLNRSEISMITYEVILTISQELIEEKPFLKYVDILDFPGARSRKGIAESDLRDNIEIGSSKFSMKVNPYLEFYLRGKVAYLFNRYSDNYEISSLLFSIDQQQLDVPSIPILLKNWIDKYIGQTPKERYETLRDLLILKRNYVNPLFIIFTKANLFFQLSPQEEKTKNYSDKWENIFKRIFIDQYTLNSDWTEKWIENGGTIQKFKNFYFIRSFYFSKQWYEWDDNNNEIKIKDVYIDFFKDLESSFKEHWFYKNYLPGPEYFENSDIWKEFTEANKDGISYLSSNLMFVANNVTKFRNITRLINNIFKQTIDIIYSYYHDENADNRIEEAIKLVGKLELTMQMVFWQSGYYLFGDFIDRMTIKENEIYQLYNKLLRNWETNVLEQRIKAVHIIWQNIPELGQAKTREEKINIILNHYKYDNIEELNEFLKQFDITIDDILDFEKNLLKNKSRILAEKAIGLWENDKLNVNRFKDFIEQGFNKKILNELFINIKIKRKKLSLENIIAKYLREFIDIPKPIIESQELMANLTAGIINKFVTSCGWDFYTNSDKQKINEVIEKFNVKIDLSYNDVAEIPVGDLDKLEELADLSIKLNNYINSREYNKEKLFFIPFIKNYFRWQENIKACILTNTDIPTFDVEANKELGFIKNKAESIILKSELNA